MGRSSCTFGGYVVVRALAPFLADIGGSVNVTTEDTPDPVIGGSVTIDDSLSTAFLNPTLGGISSDRVIGARVLIEGVEMTGLSGQVVVRDELNNPVQTAEFELSDAAVARYAEGSLSWGDKRCEIYLQSGPPGGVREFRAFRGKITGPANTGNTLPQGRFQAVSDSAEWASKPLCIVGPAYSRKHRGQLWREALQSVGASTATPDIDNFGAVVLRPYEAMGTLVPEYLKRGAELEKVHFRTNPDSSVEFISADEALAGPPVYAFSELNYDTCEEEPANAPITDWVFNGTILATDGTGGDAAPLPAGQRTVTLPITYGPDGSYTKVEVTFDKTTELFRRQTTFQVKETDGYPAAGPAVLQAVSKVEIEYRYPRIDSSSGDYNYSTRLDWRKTRRWELTGTPCSLDTGYTWASGGQYVEISARLTLLEEIEETYEYETTGCTLKTVTLLRNQLSIAPRCDPSLGSAHFYNDEDGRLAASLSQQASMRETMRSVEHWNDYRNPNVGSLPTVIANRVVTRWIPKEFAGGAYPSSLVDAYMPAEVVRREWLGDASQAAWTKTTTVSFPPGVVRTSDGSLPPPGVQTEHGTGPVPGPPSGASDVPQFAQQAFVWRVDRSELYPFTKLSRTETLEQAESIAEVQRVGEWRIAQAVGTVERIKGQTIPGLRCGDHVTVECHARSITTPKSGLVLMTEQAHSVDQNSPTAEQLTFVWLPYEAAA